MKRFRNHMLGVEQGDLLLFSDFEDDGPMWSGSGDREHRTSVAFSETFRSEPAVTAWFTLWDIANNDTARLDIVVENVTKAGFDIVVKTWGDTKVARARAGWQAIGEARHADEWDLY
ncbi:H-type lectin domain-containing protein [Pelagovum sp. HNIBRBA483]|uniref:H-type lectin domain-containing protein n=1 Tax=Pelagovum sp. HNIBRBA483 TaxID=3233341 RepID=UPI0034A30AAD